MGAYERTNPPQRKPVPSNPFGWKESANSNEDCLLLMSDTCWQDEEFCPFFWFTDVAKWPVGGCIDIVEGVNYQSEAKTALHMTKGCDMFDTPLGTMTGTWDAAVGILDGKTGIPDMTIRKSKTCFVYNPKQWLNQGCVAIDTHINSLGTSLNDNGGGVFAL
jgi:hypothetical protein